MVSEPSGSDAPAPGAVEPAQTAEPLSWPLVERRRTPQPIAGEERRRAGAAALSTTIQSAPLVPFRIAALVGAIVRSLDPNDWSDWTLIVSALIAGSYTLFATWKPAAYTDVSRSRTRAVIEMAVMTATVILSGGWLSPFALCLVPAAMLASFVGGSLFSIQLVIGAGTIITLDHLREVPAGDAVTDIALWVGLLVLVSITSGLSYRSAQESASQQQATLDRVGRLAEANALLFSLQRVAQTLPASLDLDEVLDSTVARAQSLIDHGMLTIVLLTDAPGPLEPVRALGYSSTTSYDPDQLPGPLSDALVGPKTIRVDDFGTSRRGVAPSARSGLYAALRARGAVVGLIAIESPDPHHFGPQQAEILHGLAEPFGIAIDNARLFRRLRIASADEERRRIARDLHDEIGSSLAYLGFEIDRSIAASARGESVDHELKALRDQVTTMISEVRETLYDLRSDVSETQDLAETLEQFVARVRERSGLDISFASAQQVRLGISFERELWHIAREALINVERHAQATSVTVDWETTPTAASLTIRDNGIGIAPGRRRSDAYGLRGMSERAAAIGADLSTESSPTGTVVHIALRQPKGTGSWD